MSDEQYDDKAIWPPVDPICGGLEGPLPALRRRPVVFRLSDRRPALRRLRARLFLCRSGDGPAVFVILIIGFIVVGLALWMEVSYNPPLWLHFMLWIPLTFVLCLPRCG